MRDHGAGVPGRVRLSVLGPTSATVDGAPVHLGGPRQRAVMARLCASPGVVVADDRLIDDLWGDEAPPSVVSTLQGYVSGLRRAVGDASLVSRRGNGYVLDLGRHELDSVMAEAFVRSAEEAGADEAIGFVRAARTLWRGAPFAEHLGDPWAAAVVASLEQLRTRADRVLVQSLLSTGREAEALAELEAAREREPFDEEFAVQAMLALYRCGRQAEALRLYDDVRERLLDEMGLDPTPRLVDMQLAVLRHDPALASATTSTQPSIEAEPTSHPAAPVAPVRRPLLRPMRPRQLVHATAARFVGRAAVLDQITEVLTRSVDDETVAIVVEGEPGIGKTSAVAEAARRLSATTVLWGRCFADEFVPHQPLVDAVTQALTGDDGLLRGELVIGREALARFAPQLWSAAGLLPPSRSAERHEFIDAVADLLVELSGFGPVVLVLDDVQWVDAATTSMLAALLRDERLRRVTVLATRRTTGAEPNPGFDALMADLGRSGRLCRITLSGLSLEETAELVDDAGIGERSRALHERTGGHPFHLIQLAQHDGPGLPGSLRDVLGARIDVLDPTAAEVLQAAAVLGHLATLGTVAAVTGLEVLAVADALDRVVRAGLLLDAGSGAVDFPHALVRQAVLDRCTSMRRAALHLRAADVLESAGSEASDVAHHLLEAAVVVPHERRVTATLAAASDALRRSSHEDALAWCDRLAGSELQADDHTLARVAVMRSEALRSGGAAVAARVAAREGLEAARRAGAWRTFAEAANMLAVSLGGVGFDFDGTDVEVDAALAEALERLPDDAVMLRIRMLAFRAANGFSVHPPDVLAEWSGEAVRLAEASGDARVRTVALIGDRVSHWSPEHLEFRLARSMAALDEAERSPSTQSEPAARVHLIADLIEAGMLAEAVRCYLGLRRVARRVRQPVFLSFERFFAATFLLLRGRYEQALSASAEGIAVAAEAQGVNGELAFAAQVFLEARDRGTLGQLLPLVIDTEQRFPDARVWTAGRAAAALAAGQQALVDDALARIVVDGRLDLAADSMWLLGASLAAEAAALAHDGERAATVADALAPYAGRWAIGGLGGAVLGPVDLFRGAALHAAGRSDEASVALDAAVAATDIGARAPLARALHHRAEVRHRIGHPGAEADRARAMAIAARIGLVLPS